MSRYSGRQTEGIILWEHHVNLPSQIIYEIKFMIINLRGISTKVYMNNNNVGCTNLYLLLYQLFP